ncbi:MAG TPA: peptidoglycan-binding domain-containing protein, partial [Vicinamibacteria bacterium]|nr:peptidoglycan-binding domain-containing protein [Vicinamibacteria bacterium]
MTLRRFGATIARYTGVTLAGAALLASIGCASFGTEAACTLDDGAVRVTGSARAYTFALDCQTTRIANGRVEVSAGYDPATRQTKERISHPEGKVTSTWMCPEDPWVVEGAPCQRLETSINSGRYATGLQQAIDNMPQDRPYSAQKLNADARDRLQALLIDALRPAPPAAPPPAPAPAAPAALAWPALAQGASGEAVTTLQYLLRHHGADVAVDGDFGEQTAAAVAQFRHSRGLAVKVLRGSHANETVTPETWAALIVEVGPGSQG